MHPILEQFLDRWVWPTMPGAPGAEFRLRLTREKCLKGWEISLQRTLGEIEEELGRNDEAWKKERALRGYAAEGVHMSIKQMSGQLLSVDIADQERYIDLQRMRARQIWDECKHSKLHADVLLGKGWIKDERELMDIAQANTQPLPAYFGLSMMFPHIHPLARAAQNYYQEANACIGIMAYLDRVDDPLVRHEHLSQRDEELMHFMEGKFQIDFLCATAETQKPVEDALDYLLAPGRRHQMKVRIDYAICNSCGLCREVCPESAIRPMLLEPRHLYEVQEMKCTGCGECLDYCPAPGALVQYEA